MQIQKITLILIVAALFFTSCGNSNSTGKKGSADLIKNDKLTGFMLGGIYFVTGYGGYSTVNILVRKNLTPG